MRAERERKEAGGRKEKVAMQGHGPVTGILVRRGFWSGRTKIPRKRPDKTVRPRDFGPGTEVLV